MENFTDKYKKKNPFNVPEGYFEDFSDRVMQRIDEEQRPKKVRFLQIVKPYMSLAAIFVLALVIVQVVFPLVVDDQQMLVKNEEAIIEKTETDETQLDSHFEATSDEIIEYLASEMSDYDLYYAGLY